MELIEFEYADSNKKVYINPHVVCGIKPVPESNNSCWIIFIGETFMVKGSSTEVAKILVSGRNLFTYKKKREL